MISKVYTNLIWIYGKDEKLLYILWLVVHFYRILSTSHAPTSHKKCNCARAQPAPYNQPELYKRQSSTDKVEGKALEVHPLFRTFEKGHRSLGMARLPV